VKLLSIFFIAIYSTTLFAEMINIKVSKGEYFIKTQKELKIETIELGIKCKVYNKVRFLGVPVSASEYRNENMIPFELEKINQSLTKATLETSLKLEFNLNSLTSYIHACTFLVNVEASYQGVYYTGKNLSIGDFTVNSPSDFYSSDSLSRALSYRGLFINKYTQKLNFQ